MKKLIILLIIVGLAAGGWYYYRQKQTAQAAVTKKDDKIAYTVGREDIRITVSASGRVEPEREVEIKSKASGEVIKVYADISDEVEQGKLLFQLDPTDEERSVAKLTATLDMSKAKQEQMRLAVRAAEAKLAADRSRANADLKSAETEMEEYQTRLKRARELYEQKVYTRENYDQAVTQAVQMETALANARAKLDDLTVQELELDKARQDINIAEAQVENDTVALAEAQQRLKETNIYAPITGVVSERSVQEGFIVASGVSNVGGGTTTMKIIDLSHIYSIAAVDEADISGIAPGVKAIITADAYKGMEFNGSVVRVATTGLVESNVVTFDVKVEVQGRGRKLLKPEMTTNVTFLVDERTNAIVVPAAAVVRRAVVTEDAAAPRRERGAHLRNVSAEAGNAAGEQNARKVDYSRRESFVTVRKADGTEEERKIETGITDGSMMEIVSGLGEGETILYASDQAGSRWQGQAQRRPPGPPMR